MISSYTPRVSSGRWWSFSIENNKYFSRKKKQINQRMPANEMKRKKIYWNTNHKEFIWRILIIGKFEKTRKKYIFHVRAKKKNVSNNNGIFFIQWIGMILSTIFGRGRRFDAPHTVKKFTESNKLRKIKRNAFDSGSGDSVKWRRNRIQPWQQWVG